MALTSKMACDAIAYTTSNQLKLLGLISNILYIRPDSSLSEDQYFGYLQARLGHFLKFAQRILITRILKPFHASNLNHF